MAHGDRVNEVYYGCLYSESFQQALRQRIYWMCEQGLSDRVLDVGCSQGIVSILLAREGATVVGVDVDSAAIQYAEQELLKEPPAVQQRVSFVCADVVDLPPEWNGTFTSAIMGQVLEHVVSPNRVLKRVWELLVPGGRLVVTVPFGLLEHVDHKRTYYSAGFFKTVLPYTEPVTLEVVGNCLAYVGIRREHILTDVKSIPVHLAGVGEQWLTETQRKLTKDLASAKQELTRCKKEIEVLSSKCTDLSKAVSVSSAEVSLLKEQLNKAEALVHHLSNLLATAPVTQRLSRELEQILHSAHAGNSHVRETSADLQDEIRKLQVELQQREKEVSKLRRQLEQWRVTAGKTLLPLVREVGTVERQWERAVDERDRVIQRLLRRVAQLEQSTKYQLGSLQVEAVLHPSKIPSALVTGFKMGISALSRKISGKPRQIKPISPPALPAKPARLQLRPLLELANASSLQISSHIDYDYQGSKPHIDLPKVTFPKGPIVRPDLRVAVILDEFSEIAFQYEFNMITFGPDDWEEVLRRNRPDFLFVESAWEGNGGRWKGQIANHNGPRQPLIDLINWCKTHGIPTVFWNKEDPSNFDWFIKSAALFDYVFTTDIGCVPRYKELLGHDRVGVLQFAAQPRIHNPIQVPGGRVHDVAFAGAYYAAKHPERRQQMEIVLDPAREFNLHIYDRNYRRDLGPKYEWPEKFKSHIIGDLTYEELITAHKAYKVFLNVNSVVDSPTMCSRRIFELLACGTAVISGESVAIETLFGDAVAISRSKEQTKMYLRAFLNSPELRDRKAWIGLRRVLAGHTYTHRVNAILEAIHGSVKPTAPPLVSLIVPTKRLDHLPDIVRNVGGQTYPNIELILCLHGVTTDIGQVRHDFEVAGVKNLKVITVDESKTLGFCLNRCIDIAEGQFLAKMDDDDLYAPHYLSDLMSVFKYADAEIVGKYAYYAYLEESNCLVLRNPHHEHQFTSLVSGATMLWRKELNEQVTFDEKNRGEDTSFLRKAKANGARIYSADRFNYCCIRRRDVGSHTWHISDDELLMSSKVVCYGRNLDHVIV